MPKFKADFNYLKDKFNKHPLETLIEEKVYAKDIATIRQLAKDKGYTDEWLENQLVEFNKFFQDLAIKSLTSYNLEIENLETKYDEIKNKNFEHNYSPTDYADLQFLQTLIKGRIQQEGQNQPVLIERIINDYINTQKGARAITFLANDDDIGNLVKGYYNTAYENAQSAPEKRFNEQKNTELKKLGEQISKMSSTSIIGDGIIKMINKEVQQDELKRSQDVYFTE